MRVYDTLAPSIALERATGAESVSEWLELRRRVCGLTYRPIAWREAPPWRLVDGRVEHVTGGFFFLSGVRAEADGPRPACIEQPIIVQREIGILGFLIRHSGSAPEFLVQAKAEPGNVGGVQLAPTVQATESNYLRRHGGAATKYLEYFLQPSKNGDAVADSRQSEQGTRFLGKYNRNMTVCVHGDGPEEHTSGVWRWCKAPDFLSLLRRDFLVNTDARSVLVCSDWATFAPAGRPFERWRGTGRFGEALLDSFRAGEEYAQQPLAAVVSHLHELRRGTRMRTQLCAIDTLRDWRFQHDGIVDLLGTRFHVEVYGVNAGDREVTQWEQPLLRNVYEQSVTLLCQRKQGVLHFLLRGRTEIGFAEHVQYGPSVQIDGTEIENHALVEFVEKERRLIEHAGVRQSDEGSRFMQCNAHYRILEAPAETNVPTDALSCWLTLSQVYQLAKQKGMLTNEARSALSLILADL